MMGRGDFAARLGMIGVSPYTSSGALKSESQVLYDIADWAKSQRGRMSKQQLLYQLNTLFGIDTQLGEKLLGGGSAFKKLQEDASKRMGSIDKDTTDSLDRMKTKWDELSGTMGNTTDKVIASLEKPLSFILDWSREVAKAAGEHPKWTGAVAGIGALATGIGALGGVVAGAVSGMGALAGAIVGVIGVLGTIAELGVWGLLGFGVGYGGTNLINAFRGSEDVRKNLEGYRINETTFDFDKLEKDFWNGKINPNDEAQYYSALWMLKNYKPEKYNELWQGAIAGDGAKRAEMYGIKTNLPTDIEKSSSGNGSGDTTNDIDVEMVIYSDRPADEEFYHQVGVQVGEAIAMKIPAQQAAN